MKTTILKTNNGWEYKFLYQSDGKQFCDIVSHKEIGERPETLYKYYALNEYSVDALTEFYVYATAPELLNDKHDCDSDIIKINDDETANHIIKQIIPEFNQPLTQKDIEDCDKAFYTLLYRNYGILSLSSCMPNMVMWSTYTGNEGFCIEFDYTKFPFSFFGPFPINYTDDIRQLETSEYCLEVCILYQTNVKHKEWSYEKEWRLLINCPNGFDFKTFGDASHFDDLSCHNRKMRYPLNAIKSIYLAYDFFKDFINPLPWQFDVEFPKEDLHNKVLTLLEKLRDVPVYYLDKNNKFWYDYHSLTIFKLNETRFRIMHTRIELTN